MITSNHYIELFVNGQPIELISQESLNLRLNNVLFNPTETTTTQATYSYSFQIPSTPNNDKVLDYANNLAKLNKFHARYPAQVYSDGELLFDGSLTVQSYKNKQYTCNLVNIKINTIDEIFGEMKMTNLHWDVDFNGAPSINAANSGDSKYYFPFVCYGMGQFQKTYVTKDEVGGTYTPKHQIDKYNKWWVDSFFPSLNVLETMKRAFEQKGYTVAGNAFSDPNINDIYASCNLAEDQSPIWNIGNPKFGDLTASATWSNHIQGSGTPSRTGSTNFHTNNGGVPQELQFPIEMITTEQLGANVETQYNFDAITQWNMFDTKNNTAVTVTTDDQYIYDPDEMVFVIPADGWYRIHLDVDIQLSGQGTTFRATQWTNSMKYGEDMARTKVEMKRNLASQQTPIEIQLVRNYDDNAELIKGRNNVRYHSGRPLETTYKTEGNDVRPNSVSWITDAPHQDPFGAFSPTKLDNLINQSMATRNESLKRYGNGNEMATSWTRTSFPNQSEAARGATKYNTNGFVHDDGEVMPYDQCVSPAFICGFSSISDGSSTSCNGTVAVMKNGYSWSKMSADKNEIFANVKGLTLLNKVSSGTQEVATTYNQNEYVDAPRSYCTVNNGRMQGAVNCCVKLNKNDRLQVLAIQRYFEDGQMYSCSGTVNLWIDAKSDKSEATLRGLDYPYFGWYYQNDFPYYLNLFNFTNKEKLVKDWVNDIQKAFNLEIIQNGNNIEINTNKGIKKNISYAVSLDDRVNPDAAEAAFISYPKEMSVQYQIDKDEYGFELTVPLEYIDEEDWYEHGDSGYTIIQLNDDSYETSTQNTKTNFSYTYYYAFNFKQVDSSGNEDTPKEIVIPIIEKSEYFADGYGYEEAMKHDGYSLTQRFWYRQPLTQDHVWLSSHMHEAVYLTYPVNNQNGFNLSYKDSETSIATEYFNIMPLLASNYVVLECYITPKEYKELKGGALVHLDSDLYYVSEISGYDASGRNRTKLKLIKKV